MKPELFCTWASDGASYIDNIKVKKTIKLFPVKFSATAFYNLHSHTFTHKLSCKDVLLHGKITYDPSQKAVEYRKRFGLPLAGVGKLGFFVASGRWAYDDHSQTWNPAFRVGFEFRQGGAEIVQLNAIRFKPKLFLGKHLGVEARTQLTVTLPSKLLFEMAPTAGSGGNNDDDDAFGCSLDVQQLNVVLRL